jgi:hypothetical protein
MERIQKLEASFREILGPEAFQRLNIEAIHDDNIF